ncbi:MAG: carboxypeptidase M32 [Rhodobacteraceae bacterium]|nr:carboxypeptidase M32 [Paracoccaceae bacterium]
MAAQAQYDALLAHVKATIALSQVAGLLSWDQETMMPKGAAVQRGEWFGAMETAIHARQTAPEIGEWLAALEGADLGPEAAANLRLIRRSHDRATSVPVDLAVEIARVTSVSQGIWARARAEDDFAVFAPTLARVLDLKRQEAQALAKGGDPYDAMLDDYEPGMTADKLERLLGRLRHGLVDLRDRIRGSARRVPVLDHHFPEDRQMQLASELAGAFGYDWNCGRLDKAVHPFSSGSGNDTRITTRVDPKNPFNCIYSTIHEAGHAGYEQGINPAYLLTPLGRGVSMGVHESQSRIYENQLGRSRAFCGWLFGRMRDLFGDFGIRDEDDFYALVNAVGQGFIRTEADEVQYNLHIGMRFELEHALIKGDLSVNDLEAAWNDRFLADFGFAVDRPSNGVLQDVHWSVGLFGYFPTYSLGNIHAGCLHDALTKAVPGLERDLAAGDTGNAIGWLRENLQQHGGLYEPTALIERASGRAISEEPLLAYLEAKFAGIYLS